jgi:hypothetical protein
MTFVFPFLLGGLVLVGIPVLIHLIMRQKPKSLPFPAFRFLVQKHRTNQRKLRLRHLLLLALRVLLIAAACLALARPKVFNEALKLGSDRPVAAILVFDTRPSMEYIVSSARGKLTRLDDAKRRGHEFLNQLPDGSKVLILDSADPAVSGKGEWLVSMAQARKRIDALRIRPGGGPVTARIEDAYRLFDGLARAKNDEATRRMARLLVVFSDRTRASWDTSRLPALQEAQDRVPPPFERLPSIRDRVPGVVELLGALRSRLPSPGGQDYPEKALIDVLEKARDHAAGLSEDEYPNQELSQLLSAARVRARELLRAADKLGEDIPASAKEYRDKLADVLRGLLHETRGIHEVYIDVGVDDPADGALLDFELPRDPRRNAPRQVFAADEKVTVRAVVQASGKNVVNVLRWTLDNRKLSDQPPVEVKAGEKASFPLVIDCSQFKPGEHQHHQLKAELVNPDLFPGNNVRYLTFGVRQPRDILVITDDVRHVRRWKEAHDSLRALGDFRLTTISPDKLLQDQKDNPNVLTRFHAVYLFDVAEPSGDLWTLLASQVAQGGGVGIVPGGKELVLNAYRSKEAKAVMPGELLGTRDTSRAKGQWDWESIDYQHPMMAPFQAWKGDRGTDFVSRPSSAMRYWEVKPQDAKVLVRYASGAPALLARTVSKEARPGKVVLFTTVLDERRPEWNDYLSTLTSFPVVLAFVSTSYLAGDAEPVQLNFLSGQSAPLVAVPLTQRSTDYALWRNTKHIRPVTAEPGQNVLRFPQAHDPGNYAVAGEGGKPVAAFSVNLPQEEIVLDRLPAAEVEALFGRGAVLPVDGRADLRAAMSGQWSQPVELFPFLMVLILFVLAVENLLANKFYRREPQAAA